MVNISCQDQNIRKITLKNGLRVITVIHRSSPVAEVYLYIKNGYCWEPDQLLGISHVVEHNLLVTSPNRPNRRAFAQDKRSLGAFYDAGTSYDFTEYLFLFPHSKIKEILELLYDGFFHPIFTPEVFKTEMGAVVQESQRKLDLPKPMLLEKLYETAYKVHRKRRWRLGTSESLSSLTPTHLHEFYESRYGPGNIIMTLAGDFDIDSVMELIHKTFDSVEPREVKGDYSPPEPPQDGLRYQEIRKDVGQVYWMAGFHTPLFLDPKSYPLEVAATILGKGLSSRLSLRVQEDTGLADMITTHTPDFDEYGLFIVEMETDVERLFDAEKVVMEEIARLGREGVTLEELDRAKGMIESDLLLRHDDIRKMVEWITIFEAKRGDYRKADTFLEQIYAVDGDEVQNAAKNYLNPKNLSITTIIPQKASTYRTQAELESMVEKVFKTPGVVTKKPVTLIGRSAQPLKGPYSFRLDNGINLVTLENNSTPTFSMATYFSNVRNQEERNKCGITALMQAVMLKGTRFHSTLQLVNSLEQLGAKIHPELDPDHFGFTLRAPSASFNSALEIFVEILLNPLFEEKEIELERRRLTNLITQNMDNPREYALVLLAENIFQNHPYGVNKYGTKETLSRIGKQDLLNWHSNSVDGSNICLAVAGDVAKETVFEACQRYFGKLAQGKKKIIPAWNPPSVNEPKEFTTHRQLRQTTTAIGYPTVPAGHADNASLALLWALNKGDGGRFYDEIRGKRGLAYVVYPINSTYSAGGFFGVCTSTSPQTANEAKQILLKEYGRLSTDPPTPEELEITKNFLLGMNALDERTNLDRVKNIGITLANGLELTWYLLSNERIKAVTPQILAEVAGRYFVPGKYIEIRIAGTI